MPLNELFESLIYLCTTKPTDFSMGFVRTSQEGFEPPTVRLEGECSILLSYWCFSQQKLLYIDFEIMSTSKIIISSFDTFIFTLYLLKIIKTFVRSNFCEGIDLIQGIFK